MNCSKCRLEVIDAVFCNVCGGNLHFDCAGVLETTYRKMTSEKKAAWRCITCRAGGKKSLQVDVNTESLEKQPLHESTGTPASFGDSTVLNRLEHGFTSVLNEIKALRADFSLLQVDLQSCKDGINRIDTRLDEVEPRLSGVEDRVNKLEGKTTLVAKLQSELNAATSVISTLQHENETREQYSRMNNVEISGLPYIKGENLISILDTIYTVVGLKLEVGYIDNVQRVRRFQNGHSDGNDKNHEQSSYTREPAVIVKFTRRMYKDQFLSAVRARKGITTPSIGLLGPAVNLYMGDHLTPASKLLLKRARELKRDNKLAYLWIRDCKILARKTETSKVMVIDRKFDFNKIK
jgi:predicted transcriptional regulator